MGQEQGAESSPVTSFNHLQIPADQHALNYSQVSKIVMYEEIVSIKLKVDCRRISYPVKYYTTQKKE